MKSPGIQSPFLAMLSLFLFLCFQCQPLTTQNGVGSPLDTQILNMSFTIDSTYIANSQLYARGKVTNNGTSQITPPWYVEAQFYTDSTHNTKLGGNNTQIYVPLSPNQSTFWTISFYSSNVDVRSYPGFKVSDVRAIYKK